MAAGMSIFTLMGSVFIDNDKANESIRKTEGRAEGLAKKFGSGVKVAAKWGAAIGGAAIAGGAALYGLANKTAETTDRIDKLSQRLGLSREGFQEWDYVMSQAGVSIDSMQSGMKSLTQRMQDAIEGSGVGAEAFEKLGITIDESMTQEDAFNATIEALQGMEEGIDKASLAQELFGKSGQELLPLLNSTAASTEELKLKAKELGLVLGDDAIDAGVLFTDTMDNVKRSLGGIVAKVGTEVMPIFQQGLEWVTDHMPEIQTVIQEVFKYIGIYVTEATDIFKEYLLPVFKSIFEWVKDNWPQIQSIIQKAFEVIQYVWDTVLKPTLERLWDIFEDIFIMISDNWPAIQSLFETVFEAIKVVWDNVLGPVLDVMLTILEYIVDFISDNFPAILSVVEDVFEGVGIAVSAVTDTFGWFIDKIAIAWEWLTAWNKAEVKDKTPKTPANNYTDYSYMGSHADGLAFVPFDGYVGQLHYGERVLTKEENDAYSQGDGESSSQEITINTPVYLDGKNLTTITSRVQLQNNKGKARALGVVPV